MALWLGLEARKRRVSSSGLTMESRACLHQPRGQVSADPGKALTQDEIQSTALSTTQRLMGPDVRVLQPLVLPGEYHCVNAEASTG